MTRPLPSIEGLDHPELTQLRDQIEARLAEIRAQFIAQANTLGLSIADGTGTKRRRRAKSTDAQD